MKTNQAKAREQKLQRQCAAMDSILYFDDGPCRYGVGYLKNKLVQWKVTRQKTFKATPLTLIQAAALLAEMVRDEMASNDGVCLQHGSEGQLRWLQDVSRALRA